MVQVGTVDLVPFIDSDPTLIVAEQNILIQQVLDLVNNASVNCNGYDANPLEINAFSPFLSGEIIVQVRYQCCGIQQSGS